MTEPRNSNIINKRDKPRCIEITKNCFIMFNIYDCVSSHNKDFRCVAFIALDVEIQSLKK